MDKEQTERIEELLKELAKEPKEKSVSTLTKEQNTDLLELLEFWGQIKAVVSLGSSIGKGLKWLVVFIATYAALKADLLGWLKTILVGHK